jgi:hypothetical protein
MPTWRAKASAPARISLASDFLALITGDSGWDWLTPWVWVLGVRFYDTAEFCSHGPGPRLDPLSITDFLTPTIGPDRLWDKLANVARDRIFGAFCEMAPEPTEAGWTTPTCLTDTSTRDFHWLDMIAVPVGATKYRWQMSNVSGPNPEYALYETNTSTSSYRYSYTGNAVDGSLHELNVAPAPYNESLWIEWRSSGTAATICWSFYMPAGFGPAVPWEPTAQPPVIGALEPTHNTYTSIADLGVELDHQEDKLDQLRQTLAFLVQIQAAPSLAPDEVLPGPDLPVDPPVDIPPGAIAAVVTVSSIPASSNVELLDPQRYSRLGQITLGTADGWLPSIKIEHNPQMVVPLPPWAKLIRVGVYSPATATVRFLTKL